MYAELVRGDDVISVVPDRSGVLIGEQVYKKSRPLRFHTVDHMKNFACNHHYQLRFFGDERNT